MSSAVWGIPTFLCLQNVFRARYVFKIFRHALKPLGFRSLSFGFLSLYFACSPRELQTFSDSYPTIHREFSKHISENTRCGLERLPKGPLVSESLRVSDSTEYQSFTRNLPRLSGLRAIKQWPSIFVSNRETIRFKNPKILTKPSKQTVKI